MGSYAKLFEPVKIGTMEVKNRFVMAPMVTNYCQSDGAVTDRFIAYHSARAKGGVGLIVVEATYVHPCGKGFSNEVGIYKDDLVDGLRKLVNSVHEYGAKIAIQLYHSGRQSYTTVTGTPLIAPSPIACPVCQGMPMEMTKQDIDDMIEAFGEGARRAKEAGCDAVEIHGAHGYLINQFLSAYSNTRTDEYGGSFEARAKFPLEVVKRVRETVGSDFPVLYRLSSVEHVPEGLTIEDTAEFSKMLVAHGIDAIHVSGGVYQSAAMIIQPAAIPQGVYVDNAAAIREAIGGQVPVIAVGRLKDPDMMAEIVETGKADMIALGRALLADEDLPAKLQAGKVTEIRKCIACNQGCIDRLFEDQDITCLGNPLVGREWQYDLGKKAAKKRVVVIGGGPGGLEAARVAALRGHEVFLYETKSQLGGLLNCVVLAPYKDEFGELKDFLVNQMEKLGVHVSTGQAADEKVIDRVKPDVIIMATGSRPIVPPIPGIAHKNIKNAEEILAGAFFEKEVVIIGGGAVGCETAEFMTDRGANVTILEMLDDVANDVGLLEKALLMERLNEKGVKIETKTMVKEITGAGDIVVQRDGTDDTIKDINTIVLAAGYQPEKGMQALLEYKKIPFFKIGDCVDARKVMDAMYEAFVTAYEI